MGGMASKAAPDQHEIARPWLDHPDGKWSPRPQIPFDCPVSYGIEESPVDFELDVRELGDANAASHPEVQVSPVQPIRLSFDLMVSVQNLQHIPDWSGVLTWKRLHELYAELSELFGPSIDLKAPPLLTPQEVLHIPEALWSYHAKSICAAVQVWLQQAVQHCPHHVLEAFFSNHAPASWSSTEFPHCDVLCLPLVTHISEYLGDPLDLTNFFRLSTKSIAETSSQICAMQWKCIFQEKWPVFYEALSYEPRKLETDWEALYRQMCLGKREEILEVFDREKKIGFSMSCMVAKVSWEHSSKSYVANYVSASHVQPERIPAEQKHRLRFCPAGTARDQLQPEIAPPGAAEIYPYRVLKGYDGVALGQGVELQWKMQMGSPFGWWYGKVERLERNGATAAVTLIFPHFPTNSRWYRLRVIVGDGVVRRCAIGGYHGGVRAVTAEEEKVWNQFTPKQPIMF